MSRSGELSWVNSKMILQLYQVGKISPKIVWRHHTFFPRNTAYLIGKQGINLRLFQQGFIMQFSRSLNMQIFLFQKYIITSLKSTYILLIFRNKFDWPNWKKSFKTKLLADYSSVSIMCLNDYLSWVSCLPTNSVLP